MGTLQRHGKSPRRCMAMGSSARWIVVMGMLALGAFGFEQGRMLYPDLDCTLNSAKYGATPASKCGEQTLKTYSDWYEVYMRWSLKELHNWGNVTKATFAALHQLLHRACDLHLPRHVCGAHVHPTPR